MEKFGIEKSNVISYIKNVLEDECVSEGQVTITGTSSIGDGYSGLVIFLTATGRKNGKDIKLDFALKHGCALKEFREKIPIVSAYKLETVILEKLVPTYQKILLENNCEALKCFPKWYKTFEGDNINAIVMENLKMAGFAINDIKVNLTMSHLELLMENYAKLHALGFKFKKEHPEKFNDLSNTIIKLRHDIAVFLNELYKKWFQILDEVLEKNNETELLEKKKKITFEEVLDLTNHVDEYCTIVHGDCWNNNYMFKMDGSVPEKVKILDWQICSVSNPFIDLSYCILVNISQDNYDKIENLLETYYKHFSENLVSLKMDPNEVYPKEKFFNDYKKYGKVTMFTIPSLLQMYAKSQEELPDITKSDMDFATELTNPNNVDVNKKIIIYARYLEKCGII